MKRALSIAASFLLAGALILLLGTAAKIDFSALLEALLATHPLFALGVLASTFAHVVLSAYKWRLVTRRVSPAEAARAGGLFFLFYTCLGAVMAQVVSMHVSMTAVRSIGLRFHQKVPVARGAATSLYEQVFDLLVPVVLVGPSLLVLVGAIGFAGWLLLSLAGLAVLGAGGAIWGSRAIAWLSRAVANRGPRNAPFEILRNALRGAAELQVFESGLISAIFGLSVMRYANLAFRACLVVMATGLAVDLSAVIYAMPLGQLSTLITLTPGALGIAEWTWSSLLALQGTSLALAGQFALLNRLLSLAAELIVAAAVALAFLGTRPWTRGGDERASDTRPANRDRP